MIEDSDEKTRLSVITPGSYKNLEVYLDPPDRLVKLDELKNLSAHLQRTLDEVVQNIHEHEDTKPKNLAYYIVDAKIGSFGFSLQPDVSKTNIDADLVFATFTEDLEKIKSRQYRSNLSPELLRSYKGLVRSLSDSHTKISYTYNQSAVLIDDEFRGSFEFAARDRRAGVLSVAGKIEGLNTHQNPHVFSLYPKLQGHNRIECRFPHTQLGAIADIIKQKRIVQVTGEAFFAPVGIYPTLIEVTSVPVFLNYNPSSLRERIRNMALVPEGMSAAEFLQQNREAAGIEA